MLCKEQGITVIGVCCVFDVFVANNLKLQNLPTVLNIFNRTSPPWFKRSFLRCSLLIGTTVSLLYARIKVMDAQLPHFTNFDNPAAASPSPTRQLTFNYLLAVNSWLLLNPSGLCCDWTMGTIPVISSFLDVRNFATLTFYSLFLWLGLLAVTQQTKISKCLTFSLALMSIPFLPASNLLFPVGFVVAERILYIPSMGFCILLAIGFKILYKISSMSYISKMIIYVLAANVVISFSFKTFLRNYEWESEHSLFKSAIRVNQNNAKLFNNVGHSLEGKNDHARALKYFLYAAKVQPDDIGAHVNVGRAYKNLEKYTEAENSYRKAVSLLPAIIRGKRYKTRVAPNHLGALLGLGSLISRNLSRLGEADSYYQKALRMRPSFIEAHLNRGDILLRMNKSDEALAQYRTALKYEPNNADILYNIGVVFLEKKNKIEALKSFEMGLKAFPEHKQTMYNSAILIQELHIKDMLTQAIERLERLLQLEPTSGKAYFGLGLLYMDAKRFDDAYNAYKKSIEITPNFRSALFNLALMLNNDMKKHDEALIYLRQLLQHYPNHTKGLLLLGDLNLNYEKDANSALENFRKITDIEPNNVQARHNICIVYFEMKRMHEAEKCLVEVQKLAPNEEYIRRHLGVVRNKLDIARKMKVNEVNKKLRNNL
ncbi:DgyrCDS1815 [Dimorphilus gyrociliatus]|nr:DgyrCDS1815 [Dimorphilus gyrociliatus]